jgi:hypothetical protein
MTDSKYIRITYHARLDGAEPGAIRHAGEPLSNEYETEPLVELLITREHADSRQARVALETFVGLKVLGHIAEQRAPIDVERFPHRAFRLLTDEDMKRVCDLIRRLAKGEV